MSDSLTIHALTKIWEKTVNLTHYEQQQFCTCSEALVVELRMIAANFHGAIMVLPCGPERTLASTLWYLTIMAASEAEQIYKAERRAYF